MPTIEEQHLVLPLKHGKYYYLNIDENTDKDRYYLYTEIIVPCNKLVDSTSNYIYISFMSQDITSIPDDELSDYENGLDPYRYSSLSLNIQKISNTLYCDSAYRLKDITGELEGDLFTNPIRTESSNFKIENFTDSFITVSLMILPEINKPLESIGSSTDYSTLLLFINGTQIDHVGATTKSHVLPVYKFYNSDSSIAQIVCNIYYLEQEDQIPYVIWNTEYERFIYKDLALMCYKDYTKTKKNISSNMVNYPLFDSCFRFISYGGASNNFSSMFAPYSSPYIKYTFDTNTLQQEGFKFYKVYKIIGKNPGNNIKLRIYITQAVDDNYNVFNYRYSKTNYSNITPRDVPDTDIIGIEFQLDETKDEEYIIIYLRYYNNQLRFGNDHIYSLSDDVYPTERTVQLTPGTYYNINITTVSWYSGYHVKIEDISYSGNIPLPNDITTEEKNSLFMSPNNYHWKSLWKYNRTIEYSSPLQDNPVILPLNIFTDDENENMFIEIIIDNNPVHASSPHTEDYCIALFDSLDFSSDVNDRVTNTGSEYINANFNNGVSVSYMLGTMLRVHKYSSGTKTSLNQYTSNGKKTAICFYYNSTNKKLMIHKKEENDYSNFDLEISGVDKSYLKNLYIHSTYLTEGDSVPITINFGPTSDYFQDYIDEILDQDNKPTQEIQIINKNIVKDLQFYNVSDIIGGGAVTPTPDPEYTYAAIPSGTLITEKDYNTRLDEIKEETLRIYCSHEYSNNNSVIYISNNDNFDMRSPVNILSIQAVRAKATATFTLPPDPNLETYMNTILEKYVEGFYTYNVTIDCGSQRVIDGATRARVDEFKIQKINENQFELIMVCDYVASNNYLTFQKDHSYQFDSFSTISYSYSDFGEDIYLTLMKSTVTTKLEFTIIGDYNGGQ